MDPLQDVKPSPPPTIEPQSYQQFQSDVSAFAAAMNNTLSEPPLPSSHQPHISTTMSMFPSDIVTDPLAMSMQMPTTVSPMDIVGAPLPEHIDPSVIMPSFGHENGSAFLQDPPMSGIENFEPTHHLLSSPSATTSSTTSHVSSPAMNGMVSTYVIGTSSLASALDSSRSRSGSAASPGHIPGSSSADISFPSSNSGPPTSAHETPFSFTPGFEQSFSSMLHSKESSPDTADPHFLVLTDMLKSIAKTANSGSEAFSNGQTTSAANIVDQLTKNVLLVAQMVATMQLRDQSASGSPPASGGSPHAQAASTSSASRNSPPANLGLDSVQAQHISNGLPSFDSAPSSASLDVDATDMPRKRCASTNDGDRIVKALKLEPQDEHVVLHMPPPPPHSSSFPSFAATTMSTIAEHSISSASLPSTRPPSSSGLGMKLMQDMQPPPHPSMFSGRFDFEQSLAHSQNDFAALTAGPASTPAHTTFSAANAQMWPESSRSNVSRHAHSLSGTSASGLSGLPLAVATNLAYNPPSSTASGFTSPTHPTIPSQASVSAAAAPVGRMSRSSSISQGGSPFAFGVEGQPTKAFEPQLSASRPPTSGGPRVNTNGSPNGALNGSPSGNVVASPDDDDDEDDDSDDEHPSTSRGADSKSSSLAARRGSRTSPAADSGMGAHGNEVPQEYRTEVDRIFFEFLSKICSNLEATDAKGEPIHQTLMAKKMQRLDESPDFRPFKFRIQAFTNAFLEELQRQGYPEEKIPMKKIRNFLWNQPYISRFNEEGKKSKSKGNHIWHVDAKKCESGWMFRPFQRKLAGAPPGVAYIGLRWSWTPRIWDPQASRANLPVTYTSPNLPSWLSWNEDTLSGIPSPDAESCDVTVEARFIQDGKDEMLSHTVHVNIAPMTAVDASFTPSRRPSLVGDMHNPRRVMSDSILPQQAPQRILRAQPALAPAPVVAPDSQVVQVLTTAAQRVAQEAQSQVVAASASTADFSGELESLAKQQHVLTVTAQAFNNKSNIGEPPAGTSSVLAAAAQQVVLQAARQVAADRTSASISSGVDPAQAVTTQVTVKEVSVATQSAVAQAVEMVGPLSSEVDVLMTAKSLLQQQTRPPHLASSPDQGAAAQFAAHLDATRPHSTGTLLPLGFPCGSVVPRPPPMPAFYAHTSS